VTQPTHRHHLIEILKDAYSGELAAAYAYRGHWKSVSDRAEREAIRRIENDEWIHRERVGQMLESLGARPSTIREVRMWITGRTIGAACHVIGWFLPMYFAGRLEGRNVDEYRTAAIHAGALGLVQFKEELLVMQSVEREHELFFLQAVSGHRLLPLVLPVFKWGVAEPVNSPSTVDGRPPDKVYKHPLSGKGD
jgi:Ubiquinone biosynthesis protein COQ7